MVERQILGDYWRDGAVCVRDAFDARFVDLARQAIDANLADLSPNAKRASAADDGAFIEDFCNWQRIEPLRRFVARSAGRRDRCRVDGLPHGAALPRPRARQGAGHGAAHPVAPGSSVLQRRRAAQRLDVVPGRPRRPGVDARVRRRVASRTVVHATLVPRRGRAVVPRRHPRRAAPIAGDPEVSA